MRKQNQIRNMRKDQKERRKQNSQRRNSQRRGSKDSNKLWELRHVEMVKMRDKQT
jgi:hypothetical protein